MGERLLQIGIDTPVVAALARGQNRGSHGESAMVVPDDADRGERATRAPRTQALWSNISVARPECAALRPQAFDLVVVHNREGSWRPGAMRARTCPAECRRVLRRRAPHRHRAGHATGLTAIFSVQARTLKHGAGGGTLEASSRRFPVRPTLGDREGYSFVEGMKVEGQRLS